MMNKIVFILLFLVLGLRIWSQENQSGEFKSIESALINPVVVTSLDLTGADLRVLPVDVIKLIHLEEIDLSENPNLDLDQTFEVLKKLNHLKILWLTEGGIGKIPNNIASLINIEEIWLDGNELTELPEPIKTMKKLKHLRLFDNKIEKINLKKGDLPNLESLDLCYNYFRFFPVELSVLPELKSLVIWYNHIIEIPEGIRKFKKIEYLNIDHNSLKSLPREIASLRSLKVLSLRDNQLTADGIKPVFAIKNLEELDVQGNEISEVPSEVIKLKKLKNLTLSSNPLAELPSELSRLKEIEQLGLGDLPNLNWVNAFDIMRQLPRLKRVGMYAMKLKKMPDGFSKLQQIEVFWLTFNHFDQDEKARIIQMVPTAKIDFN